MNDSLSPLVKIMPVVTHATRYNSGNWPSIPTKAFCIISAVYRRAKEFNQANENIERSSEVLACNMHFNVMLLFCFSTIHNFTVS